MIHWQSVFYEKIIHFLEEGVGVSGCWGMNCGVWAASGVWANQMVDGRGGGGVVSYESEHDLAMMVSEFMENGNCGGTDSRYSSDSDSGLPELVQLADKISVIFFFSIFVMHRKEVCIFTSG